jgi:Arc/MetJ-type ribon-helix-helix transcriptional regulator
MNKRIILRVPDSMSMQIEDRIKREYPKLKTVSELVRTAITEFLEKGGGA